ncbi:MAG: hypothetical protein KAQ79_02560 [Cyclobacteriaceae bacterium]|nr:hypothetical protein [Cyclobacteriaceae bacterium]MCK5206865.1 hypothetical protein [Cyclobacteriaceae bacterium]MCK5281311.1 hypothetical protein [Cyclobacteriaceae bacterium]
MKNLKRIATIIRLIARIWGSLILLFLLFFVGGHVFVALFGPEGSSDGGFNSTGEMLTFYFFFPVGTMIGLAIAWKWEGLGGLITVGAIIGLFIMRPDLILHPFFIGMGIIGLLFIVYWVLTRGRQLETAEIGKEQRKTRRNNIVFALLISFVALVVFQLLMYLKGHNSNITTEMDSSYNKKVEQVEVIITVEEPLIHVFAHSFEHSLASALESNGIDAKVSFNSIEPDSLSYNGKEARAFIPAATLHINIKPLYRARDDGYEAIVGTDYRVRLIDIETEKRVWRAAGKVDYIAMSSSNYTAGEGVRKEFAWNTTAAIVNAFVAEVNDQEPVRIYTVTEARQSHGQRVD